MAKAVTTTPQSGTVIEQVLIKGDLSGLTPAERSSYYKQVCESVGLNPLTKPFEYITLNGKLTLYALRACTDQLRTIHNVSVVSLEESERDGVFIVTAKVKNGEERTDMAKGAVSIKGLTGEALANALMKTETKAKRRATLSLCGLGFLDETEVETIPGAKVGEPAPVATVVTQRLETIKPGETLSIHNDSKAPVTIKTPAASEVLDDPLPSLEPDPAPEPEKPVDMNFARTVFSSVWKMIDDAKSIADINDALKANLKGLKELERGSLVNYNKLKAHATARRQAVKVDSFEEDFGSGEIQA